MSAYVASLSSATPMEQGRVACRQVSGVLERLLLSLGDAESGHRAYLRVVLQPNRPMLYLRNAACATALLALAAGVPRAATAQRPGIQRITLTADDGHPITVWRVAARAGAPKRGSVLLLHGRTWSSLPNFDLHVGTRSHSLMEAFAAAGYETWAADQRGYGATPRDSSGWLTPNRAEHDVEMVLDSMAGRARRGATPPVVIGYSFGTLYGALVATRHPEKMRAFVMYGFAVDVTKPIPLDTATRTPRRERTTAANAAEDFLSPESTPAGVKEAYMREAPERDSVRADWRHYEQFNAVDPPKMRVPVLIVGGERDPIMNGSHPATFFERLREVDRAWIIVPGTDHVLHLEKQAMFVAAVRGFVER